VHLHLCVVGRKNIEDLKMKKIAIALSVLAALTGTASAADLAARPYAKAPVMPVAPSWTGFYIFFIGTRLTIDQRQGGDGWFGTAGAGYDWQFNSAWVFGIFADGQFGSLRGTLADNFFNIAGTIKLRDTYAAGARLGYLVAPNVLSYVNAGWTGSDWSGSTLLTPSGFASGVHTNSYNTNNGVFVGGGVENNLNIFGITAPGWFMKTEYRAAYFDNKNLQEHFDVGNGLVGNDIAFKPFVQTISTSLVYRFNWSGGPVVARY
jgi:outer membrane immunogenic protein